MTAPHTGEPGQSGRSDAGARIGIVQWIQFDRRDDVERLLGDMRALGVTELRTGMSWADSHRPDGWEWFDWLIPRLTSEVSVLPCFLYTPPSIGIEPKTSSPPRDPDEFASFVGQFLDRYGSHFRWVELWNEPNNLSEWDWILDQGWFVFADMVRRAAAVAHDKGMKTALGGMSPVDPEWLHLMCDYGVVQEMDAIGIHAFPGSWEGIWRGWGDPASQVREVLRERDLPGHEVWISETGYSTWHHDPQGQLEAFVEAIDAPVERAYWYAMYDLDPDLPTVSGFHLDEREYHFGIKHADGRPKPLYHLWASGGVRAVRDAAALQATGTLAVRERRPTLITGGAGFIGTNLAHRLLGEGEPVIVLDNLSRAGVERSLSWLRQTHGDLVEIQVADVRDRFAVRRAVRRAGRVFHLAGQVAVTHSLANPIDDLEVNVRGTLNLLEEIRRAGHRPPLVFTSTNKVYGGLGDMLLARNGTRYEPAADALRAHGVSEQRPLAFHSPYGVSKGSADQYVLDYARTFRLPTVVFRMSCIYGPHQFGTEDQGWIAHFVIRALEGEPITIYGDGLQVRDALYVEDLVDALLLAQQRMPDLAGSAYNIGGGPERTLSLLELLQLIAELHGSAPRVRFAEWRPGDQRYYVSDTRRFRGATGWSPRVGVRDGVARLYRWLVEEGVGTSGPPPVARAAGGRAS